MRKLFYIVRLIIATLLLLLLVLPPVLAQNVVHTGDTTPLEIIENGSDIYTWELYDDLTVDFATIPGVSSSNSYAEFVGGTNIGTIVNIKWLKKGIYIFKVTAFDGENSGCTTNIKLGVIEVKEALPTLDAPEATVTDPKNCTLSTGTITVSFPLPDNSITFILKGTNPLQAPISNQTGIFELLPSGTYELIYTDATGAVSTALPLTVKPAFDAPEAPIAVVSPPDCSQTLGTITVTAPADNLSYMLTEISPNESSFNSKTGEFSSLEPGDYELTAINGLGCISAPTKLTVKPGLIAPEAPVADVVQPVCFPALGTVTVSSPVAGPGISFTLTGTNPIGQPITNDTGVFDQLASGDYELSTTNAVGCISAAIQLTVNTTLNPPEAPIANVSPPTCSSLLGTITVTTPIPATGITYTLTGINPLLPAKTNDTGIFDQLSSGDYELTVTNLTGCTSTPTPLTVYSGLNIPDAPIANVDPADCFPTLGTIRVLLPVPAPGITYTLTGILPMLPAKTNDTGVFDQLAAGDYELTTSNASGCVSASTPLTVTPALTAPDAPFAEVTTQPDCFISVGSITVTSPVPAAGITYTLTSSIPGVLPETNETGVFTQLVSGIYEVTTTNSVGCTSIAISKTINNVPIKTEPLRITETHIDIDNDHRVGSIDLSVSGGTGPGSYIYTWNNGVFTTEDLTNITDGIYVVVVTDGNSCNKDSLTIEILDLTNQVPIATDDEFTTQCRILKGDLLYTDNGHGIDHDFEDDPFFIDVTPVVPLDGLTLYANGSFVYEAVAGYTGDVSFQYRIYDRVNHYSLPATVTIHVISDIDHDGMPDTEDADADGDGILNIYEVMPGQDWHTTDTDEDGLPNYLDIDSDGDGILDNFESQTRAGYRAPVIYDANTNGVNDAYDLSQSGYEIHPIDSDGDGIPDFLDLDSDNDKVPDFIEGHDANHDGIADHFSIGKDSDGDGLDDGYDDKVVNDCDVEGNVTASNAAMQDTDGDGIQDWRDDNDDNDAYLTVYEDLNGDGDYSNDDIDFDGIPEYLDFGRDCDLFIPNAFSPNGDNVHDFYQIYCINHFPNAKIYIFDQMGNKLFEKAHYGNLDVWNTYENAWWNGKPNYGPANARNQLVAPGTYYYVLDLGDGEVMKSFVFVSY